MARAAGPAGECGAGATINGSHGVSVRSSAWLAAQWNWRRAMVSAHATGPLHACDGGAPPGLPAASADHSALVRFDLPPSPSNSAASTGFPVLAASGVTSGSVRCSRRRGRISSGPIPCCARVFGTFSGTFRYNFQCPQAGVTYPPRAACVHRFIHRFLHRMGSHKPLILTPDAASRAAPVAPPGSCEGHSLATTASRRTLTCRSWPWSAPPHRPATGCPTSDSGWWAAPRPRCQPACRVRQDRASRWPDRQRSAVR